MMEKEQHKVMGKKEIGQSIALVVLCLVWIGFGRALIVGNATNLSSYSLLILFFSLLNMDILFTKKKAAHRVLTILAKGCGLLFIVWAVITIVQVML